MITLTQLKYVVALAKEGHFGRAADSCGVSQPSLSTQIQKLERDQNFILFDRSKKPLKITETGKEFIKKAKQILKEVRSLEESALYSQEVKGEFSLAVIPTLAPYVLPLFLGSFLSKYPDVHLKVYEKTTGQILRGLYEDELDAGILATPLYDDQIIERLLFSEPFYVYAHKEHEINQKKKVSFEDLEKEKSLWILSEGHCFRNQVLNICGPNKAGTFENLDFESGSLETIKNLIGQGQGLSLIPELAISDIKNSVVPFEEPIPSRQVGLVYSRSFLKEKIMDALEAEILAHLPSEVRNLRSQIKVVDI